MALVKGTNSYVDVTEADTYFSDVLYSEDWDNADPAVKAQALVSATAVLDQLSWVGVAANESQALAFPRVGKYFDPRLGYEVYLADDTPDRIKSGTFELAKHLLGNTDILSSSGSVTELKVGSISLKNIRSTSILSNDVKRVIKPLLLNSGSRSWWRAN